MTFDNAQKSTYVILKKIDNPIGILRYVDWWHSETNYYEVFQLLTILQQYSSIKIYGVLDIG